MKSTIFKRILFATAITSLFTACIHDDNFDAPQSECVTLTPTKTVAEVAAAATGTPVLYANPDIIEGYVTSSDAGGTFYKSISFVSTDGAVGFSVPVDMYNIYTEFEPGRKVYVNLAGRHFNKTNGALIIGDLYEGNAVGRLVPETFRKTVKASCDAAVSEETLVNHITVSQALNDSYINKLIEFDNVQFQDAVVNTTYYNPANDLGSATNIILSDANGGNIIFRTSKFAKFAGHRVPGNSGKVRGVLTKFGSDYQFLARTEDDIKLDQPRIDSAPPLVGNAIVYSGAFTENFESYAVNNRNFPKYINDAAIGGRYWEVKSFSGNKYIQMTSFGGTPEANRSLFIVPVDMGAANTMSFQSKSGFTNGAALKVYYTMNYVPGGNIADATLIDITSSFTISPGQASGYPTNFTNSGDYMIPATLTGNGYFVFEYVGNGSGGVTSTLQIENIVVN